MNIKSQIFFIVFLFELSFIGLSQAINGIAYNHYAQRNNETETDFAVKGNLSTIQKFDSVHYKYSVQGWHYVRCTPEQLKLMVNTGEINQIYFQPSYPMALNDTMRYTQNIDSVHMGYSPLQLGYTGKGVIIGYVDTGLDFNHDDFKNADGTTRVLYYWDQSLGYDAVLTPGKYGYGQVWDSASINNGTCTSLDNNAHGTTVTGTGSGNGLATGTNKGAAPESDIIIVETNFSLPNWTLTVADAIDFIFSMADTLGKPAVVNTSVGDYLGSHDGLDPAALYIDSLLNDKPGRIVVAAAGNSGAQGKYHVHGNVNADTSFCWFQVNASSAFGEPAVYFDLWVDTADFNDVYFAFGADNTSPVFDFRGRTQFYNILDIIDSTVIDSIMAGPNKLAPVEFSTQLYDGLYHIELLIASPDSAAYFFRFETFGDGAYDLWSGAWMGLSNIVSTALPDVLSFPDIAFYQMPDTLITIVSSWTCSENVVTVGNLKNQLDYLDVNNNNFVLPGVPVGMLTVNSSKGPNRLGYIKPDVSATGDGTLSACPLWLQASLITSNPAMLAQGGQHVRNGGTSMASPVIAGIAALYLEKCPEGTHTQFIDMLHQNAYDDSWTGVTPNNAYGYGKVNAFQLLNTTNFDVTLIGDSVICDAPLVFETLENNFSAYAWTTGATTASINLNVADTISVIVTDANGCRAYSDTIPVIQGAVPTFPIINILGGGLITTTADSLIWYLNGNPISNSNSQYLNPDTSGNYSVQVFSIDGCNFISDEIYVDQTMIDELSKNEFVVFPNPFVDELYLIKNEFYDIGLTLNDATGKLVYNTYSLSTDGLFITINTESLAAGVYYLSVYYQNNFKSYILLKQ